MTDWSSQLSFYQAAGTELTHNRSSTFTYPSHSIPSSSVRSGHLPTESLHLVLHLLHSSALHTDYRASQSSPTSLECRFGYGSWSPCWISCIRQGVGRGWFLGTLCSLLLWRPQLTFGKLYLLTSENTINSRSGPLRVQTSQATGVM